MNTLILGVGNLLLQDEGAGVRALAELENGYLLPAGVGLLDGGTSGLELIRTVRNEGYVFTPRVQRV